MATQSEKPQQDIRLTFQEALGPIIFRLDPVVQLTDDQLLDLCGLNRELRIERNAYGDLEIMLPAYAVTGYQNAYITAKLGKWAEGDDKGVAFDSSVGFTLRNSAMRSPDASWILKSRIQELPDEEKYKFARICPDFVAELRSGADSLRALRAKMDEYIENGARLGWLIDPLDYRVYVYRPNAPVEILEGPETLSGEPELPGFTLDLKPVWEPAF